MADTIKEADLLNTAFNEKKLLSANEQELKLYLMACVEMRESDIKNPRVKEGLPKRTEFIRELISIEATRREHRIAKFSAVSAAVFAAGALIISIGGQAIRSRGVEPAPKVISKTQAPDAPTVKDLVAKSVKLSLELHLGQVEVSVEKYLLGEPSTRKSDVGVFADFPCKAIYSTLDGRGNLNKDVTWLGQIVRDEFGRWHAVPSWMIAAKP
jgi:hypothetical protein